MYIQSIKKELCLIVTNKLIIILALVFKMRSAQYNRAIKSFTKCKNIYKKLSFEVATTLFHARALFRWNEMPYPSICSSIYPPRIVLKQEVRLRTKTHSNMAPLHTAS